MSSLEIFEVQFDFTHVLVYVPAGHDVLFGGDTFLFIIDADQYDRNVCTQCNVVESLFPVRVGRAGSFRRNGKMELVACLDLLDDLVYQRGMFVAVYGYSSHPAEQDAERKEEPFLFHHESRLASYGTDEQFADNQIPVGSMRGCTNDAFVEIRDGNFGFPSQYLIVDKAANGLFHAPYLPSSSSFLKIASVPLLKSSFSFL